MSYSLVLFLDFLSCALLGWAAAFRGGRHGLPFTGAVILGMACALLSPAARSVALSLGAQILPHVNVFDERAYVAASFLGACAGSLLHGRVSEERSIFAVVEGASLALATALGTHMALAIGLASPIGGVMIGCLAGSAGGVLRDLCLTERPALLEADFYGGAIVVGAMLVTGLYALHMTFGAQMAVGGGCVFGLRLLGSRRMRRRGMLTEF